MALQHRHACLKHPSMRRVLWLLVGIGHLPGLFEAWQHVVVVGLDSAALGSCIGLTLTTLFIALKVRDVAFLRLREGRRTLVAACLVVALLHVDVVRPNAESSVLPDVAALATMAWITGVPTVIRRLVAAGFSRIHTVKDHCVKPGRFIGTVWLDAARPHCWLLARSLFLLRAPPA